MDLGLEYSCHIHLTSNSRWPIRYTGTSCITRKTNCQQLSQALYIAADHVSGRSLRFQGSEPAIWHWEQLFAKPLRCTYCLQPIQPEIAICMLTVGAASHVPGGRRTCSNFQFLNGPAAAHGTLLSRIIPTILSCRIDCFHVIVHSSVGEAFHCIAASSGLCSMWHIREEDDRCKQKGIELYL